MQKAANTDEAEKNEPDLDIPAELERRQARLAAIVAAKARLEERQRQSDTLRGRSPDDERQPKDKDGKPKGGKPYQRDFGAPAAKAQALGDRASDDAEKDVRTAARPCRQRSRFHAGGSSCRIQ